jgi:SAM-dependent methyltransferase
VSFDVAAEAYDRFMGRYSRLLSPQLADLAGVRGGQRVLDVGCGPGALTAELVSRLGPAAVSAVDPSEPFVAAARARNPGVDICRASAEELPFPDGTFDAALALHGGSGRWTGRDGSRDPAGWCRRGMRVGSQRRARPAQPVLAGGARARPGRRRRIPPRGRTAGPANVLTSALSTLNSLEAPLETERARELMAGLT